MVDETEVLLKRERSPSFPYLDLAQSIEMVKKIYAEAKGSEVRLQDVARILGSSASSGTFNRYLAALQAYGLIETSGSGDFRKIRISDNGKKLLLDNRPDVRENLAAEAVLKPQIMAEIHQLWKDDQPSDEIAKSQLQFDLGFTTDAARRLLMVFNANRMYLRNDNLNNETTDCNLDETYGVADEEPTISKNVVITPDPIVVSTNYSPGKRN